LRASPIRPSELADGVPAELDALILRLLEKRPQRRVGHAADVAAALERLGAEDGLASEGPRPRAYLYRPGFTGRQEPLRELGERLTRLQSGSGGLELIGGGSGVGKTRLVMELARQAKHRKLGVLTGECVPLATVEAAGEARPSVPLQPLR